MADFDFKEKFPISQYIDGVIKKKQIEDASREAGRQSILQGINSIVDDGMAYKKNRALDAEALTRAQILGEKQPDLLSGFMKDKPAPMAGLPLPEGMQKPGEMGQTQVSFSDTKSARDAAVKALANSIRGIESKDFLNYMKPDATLYPVITTNRSTGEQEIKYIAGQKGAKPTTVSFGANAGTIGGMKDDRQRQMAAMRLKDAANKEINNILGGEQQIGSMARIYDELAANNVAGEGYLTGVSEIGSKLSFGKYEPKIKAYNDIRKGMLARLKGITGDTGVLTETDAQRIIELLPDLKDSKEVKNIKMSEIGAVLETARQRRMNSTNTLMQEIQSGENISPLSSTNINSPQTSLSTKDPKARLEELRRKRDAGTLGK